jgi:D-glycero-D-manno-heptose 1,7-bisphosphate phosphatase
MPISSTSNGAVFIDKNGTLVEALPGNVDPSQLRFMPNALEGLRMLASQGHALIVVTSEPGLGQGVVARSALTRLERALATRLREEAGITLAGFYTCPHKPGLRGEPACLCRVPAPGLLRQAAISHRLDLRRSWMIGDMLDDVEAGRRVGCRTVLVDAGHETTWRMSPLRTPHHRAADLLEAAQVIGSSSESGALALEIEADRVLPRGGSAARKAPLHGGPLRGFEPHPTREWL